MNNLIIIILILLLIGIVINIIIVNLPEKELTISEKQDIMAKSIYDSRQREEIRAIKKELAVNYINNFNEEN